MRKKLQPRGSRRVQKGIIKSVEETKYLGQWINNKGNNKTKIRKKNDKINHMIITARRYCSEDNVGKMAIPIRIKILETVIMPTLTYGMETWTKEIFKT